MEGNRSQPGTLHHSSPLGTAFYRAGSGLTRGGLGAYGERFLGSSSEFMQSNVSQWLSDPQYYFQVNGQYVRNKLKMILFLFLHRGHWARITEAVGGRLFYKLPFMDINAPELYIPFMAFDSYVVLTGFSLGVLEALAQHSLVLSFTPEALSLQFSEGLVGWLAQVLLRAHLYSMGSSEAPLVDVVAYAGYAFASMSLAILARIFWNYEKHSSHGRGSIPPIVLAWQRWSVTLNARLQCSENHQFCDERRTNLGFSLLSYVFVVILHCDEYLYVVDGCPCGQDFKSSLIHSFM